MSQVKKETVVAVVDPSNANDPSKPSNANDPLLPAEGDKKSKVDIVRALLFK